MAGAVTLRPATEQDLDAAAEVSFVAFHEVAVAHGMAPATRSPAASRQYLRHLHGIDPLGGIVAEEGAEIVGVVWRHVRGPVVTIGPLAVAPVAQGCGIGRALLAEALLPGGRAAAQVRLVHESFNTTALGCYLRAGFRVVAPLLEVELPAGAACGGRDPDEGLVIRAACRADVAAVVARDARAFGAPRPQSIERYFDHGEVIVATAGDRLAGFVLVLRGRAVAHLGSASADDGATLLALLARAAAGQAAAGAAVRVLVPATDRTLVDGLLGLGFRVARACHYMIRGGGTAPPPNYVLMNGDLM